MAQDVFKTLRDFTPSPGKKGRYHSLAALEEAGLGKISRLPRSIRVVLEALVRQCDGKLVTEEHVRNLAAWQANGKRGLVLTGDLETMAALHNASPEIVHRINLGGIHHRPGRRERLPFVYLTDQELRTLTALEEHGAVITAQDLPTTPPVALANLG